MSLHSRRTSSLAFFAIMISALGLDWLRQALRRAADEAQDGRILLARDDASDYILAK
jgi:hypothetical protein